jgi:hypothetical protein
LTNNLIYVTFHSGNADNSAVAENAARLGIRNKGQADGQTAEAIEGGKISTGIYTASVIYPATPNDSNAAPSPSIIFPVWQDSTSNGGAAGIKFHTGSAITVKTFDEFNTNPNPNYVTNVTNLKDSYTRNEKARFRLYVREKDWNPTVYTVANTTIENTVIEDAYFKIYRIVDDIEAISYGTGSATTPQASGSAGSYTRLSYDISGNYFDLDKFSYYTGGRFEEQSEVFKFRVE